MTYCYVAAVLVLVGLTKKRFGHYAILKILSLRSPRYLKRLLQLFQFVKKTHMDTNCFHAAR